LSSRQVFAWARCGAYCGGGRSPLEPSLAPPMQEIIRKVEEWRPDLVIIGQHGRGRSKRAGLGRVAKRLFKEANCSVRIARARVRPHGAPLRIVIPLTASQNLKATARVVTSRLWPPGTEIKLVASLGPILREARRVGGALDSQVEAGAGGVMGLPPPVPRRLTSAH